MKNMMKGIKHTMSPHAIGQRIGLNTGLVLLLLMLMACSGGGSGGGGGGGDLLAGGGIGGTGISIGTISGFGSVIVNDVHFSTEDTEVMVNGAPKGEGDSVMRSWLAKGMVVRVEARYPIAGGAIAERIVFTSNLNGPVQSIATIDSVVKMLSIMGQNVFIDDQTQFEENTVFNHIAENNVLEVSGWPDEGGEIHATYINKISEMPEPGTGVMIKGIVTAIDDPLTFRINQLVVDLSAIDGPLLPAAGQLVIIHGVLDENDILVASSLEFENELGVDNADSFEIEGIVSQISLLPADDYDFILGTTNVQSDDATEFVGLTLEDIIPGARLLVKGALFDGVLLADEVKAKDKVDIEGSVATVDRDEEEITLKGLSPLVVSINSATKIFGEASELNEINVGQHVKILGHAAGVNQVVAGQVKVNKNVRRKVKLQGPIGESHELNITIFGIAIDTTRIPDNAFYTAKDGNVSRSDFLVQIAERNTVNLMGNLDGDTVKWKEIELLDFEN